jgi:uncharacterized protein (UPF0332 family)
MDAIDFLESAKQSLVSDSKEVNYRNAASRAYYSAFHFCRSLMEKYPEWQMNIGIAEHAKLIGNLKKAPRQEFRTLGNQLHQLKRLRSHADYELNKKFTDRYAKQAILQSEKILEEISKLDQADK